MQIRFKYLIEDRDRHGNIRVYVRVPGRRKVRIRAPFGTDKFTADYNAAVSEHVSAPRQAGAAKTGSFRHGACFISPVTAKALPAKIRIDHLLSLLFIMGFGTIALTRL